jgi:hypothetical protein
MLNNRFNEHNQKNHAVKLRKTEPLSQRAGNQAPRDALRESCQTRQTERVRPRRCRSPAGAGFNAEADGRLATWRFGQCALKTVVGQDGRREAGQSDCESGTGATAGCRDAGVVDI